MSGTALIKSGAVISTNAALKVITGFEPRSVLLFLDDGASGAWNVAMVDASAYKRITAGTGSLVTSDGITPAYDGFTIGADAELNPSSATTIYFMAFQ